MTASDVFRLNLSGQLPSGKNRQGLRYQKGEVGVPSRDLRYGRGRSITIGQMPQLLRKKGIVRYPRARFSDWPTAAEEEIFLQTRSWRLHMPLCEPMILTVRYWPGDRIVRDVAGMLDALGHLLEHAGVLKDDGLIRGLVWHPMPLDRARPRVVLCLAPLARMDCMEPLQG